MFNIRTSWKSTFYKNWCEKYTGDSESVKLPAAYVGKC